jgi:dihydropyrimidine dehydrogenase (NAD+) subunit PreA
MSVDRSVTFTGIKFENPFLLSSAPPTESESNITRAFAGGWGGVVTKTIGLHPDLNVYRANAKLMRTGADDAQVSMK